jgi:crotonobetainyl-CoA:carnitine CoA-transferase CaiB-like acyl-CoA transferase
MVTLMVPRPLAGLRVLCVAAYLPAPITAARLAELGAKVIRVAPPQGDALQTLAPEWYATLLGTQVVIPLDLKQPADLERLHELLAESDLLLTAMRPAALARVGLTWEALHGRYPRCCHVAIVGFPGADAEHPGHDLTYQAWAGTLEPPALPRTFLADQAGAEHAATVAVSLLLARERGGAPARVEVSLAEAAKSFAEPLRMGLTAEGGLFGGGAPGYRLYETRNGWLAVAAVEPRFLAELEEQLAGVPFEEAFLVRTALEWEEWGRQLGLPLTAVRRPA